jgi:hypothetical protein
VRHKRPPRPPEPPKHPDTRFRYDCIVVRFWEERLFSVDQMRDAVELLRTAPDTTHSGLSAVAQVKHGELFVMAQPVIPYREIVGKTPKKLWAMLDERVESLVGTDT